jgi:flavodoxin I
MGKAAIIFGSSTGNTETAARIIAGVLQDKGWDLSLMDVDGLPVTELEKDYDLILLGSSTWGEDEIELQEDFASFYEQMDSVPLTGRKLAVFGCGDSSYTYFCGAVDAIAEKVENMGGTLVSEPLKIDGDPADVKEEIIGWAEALAVNPG